MTVEFNFGEDDTWVTGTEADPGRWVAEHTYSTTGVHTITARHVDSGLEGDTTFEVVADQPDPVITSVTPSSVASDVRTTYTAVGTDLGSATKAARRIQGGDGTWGFVESFVSTGDTGFTYSGQHSGPNVIDIAAVDANDVHIAEIIGAVTVEAPITRLGPLSMNPVDAASDEPTVGFFLNGLDVTAPADPAASLWVGINGAAPVSKGSFTYQNIAYPQWFINTTAADLGWAADDEVVVELRLDADANTRSDPLVYTVPPPPPWRFSGPVTTIPAQPLAPDVPTTIRQTFTGDMTGVTVELEVFPQGGNPSARYPMTETTDNVYEAALPTEFTHQGTNTAYVYAEPSGKFQFVAITRTAADAPPPAIVSITPGDAKMDVSTLYTVVGTDLPDTITQVSITSGGTVAVANLTPTGFTFTANIHYPTSYMTTIDVIAKDAAGTEIVRTTLAAPDDPIIFSVSPSNPTLNAATTFTATGWRLGDGTEVRIGTSGVGFDDENPTTIDEMGLTVTITCTRTGVHDFILNASGGAAYARKDDCITVA